MIVAKKTVNLYYKEMRTKTVERTINLQDKDYEYVLHQGQNIKRVSLIVGNGGKFCVKCPEGFPINLIELFIQKKSAWVLKSMQKIANIKRLPSAAGYQDFLKLREHAHEIATARIEYFSNFYNFEHNKIFIKKMGTRWGSCSSKKNLNFNYKLVFLPSRLQDYLIVHELCHLKEMNHSERFWKLVAKMQPEHKKLNRELRRILI